MATRRVLVTGCSSGIGLAVAVRLAKDELQRFKVVATMRDVEKRAALETAAGEMLGRSLEIHQLDVCCEDSIRECVNSLPGRRLDILVSNAGMGMIGPLECQSVKGMQDVFNTNFFGLVRLVKEVLPDMKRRQSGHIVVMSSVMGIQGLLFNDVYAASKFAVEGLCESLAVQAMTFNIKMTLVEPGPVLTEFERKVYEDAQNMDLSGTDDETARIFREIYLPYSGKVFSSLGQRPEEVAEFAHRECYPWSNVYKAANIRADCIKGSSVSSPDQSSVHAHDRHEARRPYRTPASRRLLQDHLPARPSV
ncbi:retinol dehydrogenase 8 isoform X2 [Ictalurus furcatus]|uniref:retinol dehydrogenase 8 isoform X2 n=1 Tax=Ictalurus furcatus TaxID=66913 RepID=UPI00234FC46F|nr:retinol dehydrogenase 8 isoform X2 [Ictalurus furcatus]